MFAHSFQNGDQGVEVITAAGKGSHEKLLKVSGPVKRVYRKDVKGFVYDISSEQPVHFASLQCPAVKKGLGACLNYLSAFCYYLLAVKSIANKIPRQQYSRCRSQAGLFDISDIDIGTFGRLC
jgi:hypothetical protein